MNAVLFFLGIACLQASILLPKQRDGLIVEAAFQVLLDTFSNGFDSVYFISLLTSKDFEDSSGQLIQKATQLLAVVVESFNTTIKTSANQHYNIILMDSSESLDHFNTIILAKNFDPSGFFLVLLLSEPDASTLRSQILHLTANYLIYNVNVLYRIHKSVASYTYFPYGTPGDQRTRSARWNTFMEKGFVSTKLHFPSKFENLFGAQLAVAVFQTNSFMDFDLDKSGFIVGYKGIDGILLETIAKALNFTIHPVVPDNNQRWGILRKNGSATGAMGLLLNGTVNFTLGFFGNNYLRMQYLSGTQSYYQTALVLAVTPGTAYGSFEKLLLPFQLNLWTYFASMLAIALLVILILRYFPTYVQSFVLGRNNRTPVLNLVQATIGIQVSPTPSRNFARFLLTLWMLATFVLRAAYQQIMFYNFHHSRNHSIVRNWDEFISGDYHIYVIPAERYLLDNLHEHIQQRIAIVPAERSNDTLQAIRNSFILGARISYPESIYYQNMQVLNSGGPFYHQFAERLYTHSLSVFFRKNSPLVGPFDGQIQPLVTHGFVEHWRSELLNRNLHDIIRTRMRRARATPLGMPMLAGVFKLYALGMVCAIGGFLVEIWVERIRNRFLSQNNHGFFVH